MPFAQTLSTPTTPALLFHDKASFCAAPPQTRLRPKKLLSKLDSHPSAPILAISAPVHFLARLLDIVSP